MKYTISRSSHGYCKEDKDGNPVPPHPGAAQEPFPVRQRNTAKNESEYFCNQRAYTSTPRGWHDDGTNHTTWSGGICRQMGTELYWTLEIPDLFAFVNSVGRCVLTPPSDPKETDSAGLWHIEIYDGYRE